MGKARALTGLGLFTFVELISFYLELSPGSGRASLGPQVHQTQVSRGRTFSDWGEARARGQAQPGLRRSQKRPKLPQIKAEHHRS